MDARVDRMSMDDLARLVEIAIRDAGWRLAGDSPDGQVPCSPRDRVAAVGVFRHEDYRVAALLQVLAYAAAWETMRDLSARSLGARSTSAVDLLLRAWGWDGTDGAVRAPVPVTFVETRARDINRLTNAVMARLARPLSHDRGAQTSRSVRERPL